MPVVGEMEVGGAWARLGIVEGDGYGDRGTLPAGEEGRGRVLFVCVVTMEAVVPRGLAGDGGGDGGVVEGGGRVLAAFVAGRRGRRERRGRLNGLQLRGWGERGGKGCWD